jgi:hypothetical protein
VTAFTAPPSVSVRTSITAPPGAAAEAAMVRPRTLLVPMNDLPAISTATPAGTMSLTWPATAVA